MEEIVLVTGASGYIASHVVNQLLQQNYKVRGTVRNLGDRKKVEPIQKLSEGCQGQLELVEADLLNEECWEKVVSGCRYVLHTASPFPSANPKSEDELIKPAVEGTLNVLRACSKASTVERVVLTSSVASVSSGHDPTNRIFTEDDWTDTEKVNMVYEKSKTLAEKAAWDYMKTDSNFELAVINPVLVMGPILCGTFTTSMEIPKRLLNHEMPLLPKLNFPIVDVRDVASAHIVAMKQPDASGHRHIVTSGNMWIQDMAKVMKTEFGKQGYNIPQKLAPYPFLWLLGRFDKTVKMVLPEVGKVLVYDNKRMVDVLKIKPRSLEETVIEMCYSLIELNHVKKTQAYKPPQSADL